MRTRRARGAAFYDARIADAMAGAADSPYRGLWEAALGMVDPGSSVVELGCGTGRFGALVAARAAAYTGLDFAPALVEEARRHAPGLDFRVADLRTDQIPGAGVYVALEVLEHLADDRALLERLPRGATVVLSVPSFDSASHVRRFPAVGSAVDRYRRQLRVEQAVYVQLPRPGAFFHLLRGVRP